MAELESFAFYTPDSVGDAVYYLNGHSSLLQAGCYGLLKLIRQEIRSPAQEAV